ncbi:hypothetical protein HMPREF0083_02313 [Aneurinibacillus aneurinilyticus ATCC 12856]|uniref:Uncharacterized protein n=1 Tax=Aneurinibacillus aneurinilyticus ATCC 12856 TaxID=649747 RepID=U1X3P7_ANEAE|nr:hypothetical protein HMPREF0083_02313 [Aneurinibacillus aneurinilyticus ATCC 12856]
MKKTRSLPSILFFAGRPDVRLMSLLSKNTRQSFLVYTLGNLAGIFIDQPSYYA